MLEVPRVISLPGGVVICFVFPMPLNARIDFLLQKIAGGHPVTVSLLPNPVNKKLKVKTVIKPSIRYLPTSIQQPILNVLHDLMFFEPWKT